LLSLLLLFSSHLADRYNQTGISDCTLGNNDYMTAILATGNVSTYLGLKYSDDYCYMTPMGTVKGDLATSTGFCNRMGGILPELRTATASAHLETVVGLTPVLLGLVKDPTNGTVWRWQSDNSVDPNWHPPIGLTDNCTTFRPWVVNSTYYGICYDEYQVACQLC
jgi:hypothetical protein